ncbi:hypothetical protein COZ22_00800 [bacterium (Candidatus Howlettbacteria) CG_4_10_14_3_um_filter_37_10]|nr:MAG: hypothetical protein COX25_01170 [bacterium (Candidatus Howlettbacteria) CG23_combo_of_CG06-09_8_20_14_all_37_9]PIY00213.1 MAG: hypothetical protein COZ22_00800 [bacterium (Candidatus Howlettbacteria) CG_4_10_14_3_um_filter_37_10]
MNNPSNEVSGLNKILDSLIESAEINVLLINGQNDLKGIAQVTFAGGLEVNGFRITKSKFPDKQLYVQPPSYLSKKGYTKCFYLRDEDLWKRLEEKIEEVYDSGRFDEAVKESI